MTAVAVRRSGGAAREARLAVGQREHRVAVEVADGLRRAERVEPLPVAVGPRLVLGVGEEVLPVGGVRERLAARDRVEPLVHSVAARTAARSRSVTFGSATRRSTAAGRCARTAARSKCETNISTNAW